MPYVYLFVAGRFGSSAQRVDDLYIHLGMALLSSSEANNYPNRTKHYCGFKTILCCRCGVKQQRFHSLECALCAVACCLLSQARIIMASTPKILPFLLVVLLPMTQSALPSDALLIQQGGLSLTLAPPSFGVTSISLFDNPSVLSSDPPPQWACHGWTPAEQQRINNGTSAQVVCESTSGNIFTRGNNTDYKGCGTCWC